MWKALSIMVAVFVLAFSACRSVDEVGEIEVIFNGTDGASIKVYQNGEAIFNFVAEVVARLSDDTEQYTSSGLRYSGSRLYQWNEEATSFFAVRYGRLRQSLFDTDSVSVPIMSASETRKGGDSQFIEVSFYDYDLIRRMKPEIRQSMKSHDFLVREGELFIVAVDSLGNVFGRLRGKLEIGSYLEL